MQLHGIHHLTAITADASGNHDFYTETLGLRLVKKTVNQDDVSAYHLFYGDGVASPGSDITFFDWPVARERRGGNAVTRTGFRVAGEDTLSWWSERFDRLGVRHGGAGERDGRAVLDFEDPEGQRLSLVADDDGGEAHPWADSPVPPERQIRGLGPVEFTVPELAPTRLMLTVLMGAHEARTYADPRSPAHRVHVFELAAGGPQGEIHVAERPDMPPASQGAGGVHHVAFRCRDEEYDDWFERLKAMRIPSSGKVDRFYFRSLYFREPNGILFEIATDGPGFTADEPLSRLGQGLALPPFLESRRQEIEAGLTPL